MNIPLVLTAQAILKARPGGISLLDTTVEVNDYNRRKFCAAPANIKKAVDEFKKAGFSVSSVGKISMNIMGPTYLFEQTFKIAIITDEAGYITVENSTRLGFIQPNGFLENELEGVVLNQEGDQYFTRYGPDPPVMDPNKICKYEPSKIPGLLGFDNAENFLKIKLVLKKILEKNKYKVIVNVLDSGFYKHPYFKRYKGMEVHVYRNTEGADKFARQIVGETKKLRKIFSDLDIIERESKTKDITGHPLYKEIMNDKDMSAKLKLDIGMTHTKDDLKTFRAKDRSMADVDRLLQDIRIYRNEDDDYNGHGTKVIASLFPILELLDPAHLEIRMHKDAPGLHTNEFFERFDVIPELKIKPDELHIISCSYGTTQMWDSKALPEHINVLRGNISIAAGKGIILYSSGNNYGENKKYRAFQAQLKDVITVGGAFKKADNMMASDFAHGYISDLYTAAPKIVPDICGLCGPVDDEEYIGGIVWLPFYDYAAKQDAWSSTGGTSFATPQVAAACAILKLMKPDLTLYDLKDIFKTTQTGITSGNFFSPVPSMVSNATKAGLVNVLASIMKVYKIIK
jgi:hypothetical protein